MCWEYRCDSQTDLKLVIDDIDFDCPEAGGEIDITDAIGNGATTTCPPASLLCRQVQGFANDNILVNVNGTWVYEGAAVSTQANLFLSGLAVFWAVIAAVM